MKLYLNTFEYILDNKNIVVGTFSLCMMLIVKERVKKGSTLTSTRYEAIQGTRWSKNSLIKVLFNQGESVCLYDIRVF